MNAGPSEVVDIEIEVERFVADLLPVGARHRGHRGPQPLMTFTTICVRALEIIDAEGLAALTVRRLADELHISTRTLYKRIGSQYELLRGVANLHLSRLNVGVRELDCWETTAWMWCVELHRELRAHPHLTELLTDHDFQMFGSHVRDLAKLATREGIPETAASAACRSLVNVTVNDALRSTRSVGHSAGLDGNAVINLTSDLVRTVQWIIAGVRAQFTTTRDRPARSGG